ncbi:MAG: hypothetical protein GMKNLPBB_00361 [Myxococcota bacterium]|nr:hypothetical protein [Myxococcota bacterium]
MNSGPVYLLFAALVAFAIAVFAFFRTYNLLLALRKEARADFFQLGLAFKRRADAIQLLMDGCKDAVKASHPEEYRACARALMEALRADGAQQVQQAEQALGFAMEGLLEIVRASPELRERKEVRKAFKQLTGSHMEIQMLVRQYNQSSKTYNGALTGVLTGAVASIFHFQPEEKFLYSPPPMD